MIETEKQKNSDLEELRKDTIKLLEYNYAHGFIDLSDFEKRLESAVHAISAADLSLITDNLEEIPLQADEAAGSFVNTGVIREDETYTGILSGIKRKGKWKPARNNRVFVFLGGIDLDFSEAELAPGVTDFEFFCVLGGIDLIVPEGINVDLSGVPVLGGLENKLSGEHYPGQPTIKIHGMIFLGGVEIKPPKKRKKRSAK